jgi:pre-mRNA-splicing factor CWC26
VRIIDDDDDNDTRNERSNNRQNSEPAVDKEDEVIRRAALRQLAGDEADNSDDDGNEAEIAAVMAEGPVIVDERSLPRINRGNVDNPAGTWVSLGENEAGDGRAGVTTRQRHDSDDEQDMPRSRAAADSSPPRAARHDSDNDTSPPRRPAAAAESGGARRRKELIDDDGDLSPPRHGAEDSDGDLDVRRRRTDTAATHAKAASSAVNTAALANASEGERALAVLRAREEKATRARMSSGVAGGLQLASELRADAERLRAEEASRLASVDPELLGRGAAAVVRDKKGRRLTPAEIAASRAPQTASDADVNAEWGKGLTQRAELQERVDELVAAREAPFARRIEDIDDMLKQRERWGDPMANRKSGDADVVAREPAVYKGPAPTNRFNIRPGALWDGVDRSNGFEGRYFQRRNAKLATATERYHW